MSSYLTVVYGARRFKVPVTPSTLLGQVRDEVCTGANGLNLSSADYGLARQGKSLDLTVPFRFANLVNNAQVDLVKLKTSTETPIRVKIRVPNGKDFVGTFPGGTSIADVATAAGLPNVPLTLGGNVPADPASALRSLGGGAGGLLLTATKGVSAKSTGRSQTSQPASKPVASAATTPNQTKPESEAPKPPREAVVVTRHHSPTEYSAEDPPEMGVSQFRTYHSHLKAQAEPAMITRETRERMKNERRNQIEATTIRIKLPDQSFLEGKFQKGEHGDQVYTFVRSYLRQRNHPFVLKSTNPTFTLKPEQHLLDDCHFGSRAMLIFEWVGAPPSGSESILNNQAMSLAKPIGGKDQVGPTVSKKEPASKPATPAPEPSESTKKDSFKKVVPKWMRLHKK